MIVLRGILLWARLSSRNVEVVELDVEHQFCSGSGNGALMLPIQCQYSNSKNEMLNISYPLRE